MERTKPLRKYSFGILFALILLAQISFVIYKADYTGITYDEAYSYLFFAQSTHEALTSYVNPNNNHVLNSLFMCLVDKHFSSYEHFIRLHSIGFAVLFSLSVAYIIHKTMTHGLLKIVIIGLVLLNWFIFDLSYLARGYSIALGAFYLGLALLLKLMSKKISYKFCFWLPILVLSATNFLALGSMVSSTFVLISMNAVFIFLFSHCVFRNVPNKIRYLLVNLISILLLSSVCLYPLYKDLYRDIFAARDNFGKATFSTHIKQLLVDSLSSQQNPLGLVALYILIFMVSLALVFAVSRSFRQINAGIWRQWLYSHSPASFVILITLGTILIMFIHRTLLGMSLGFMRNSVFLVPLVLISSGILVDKLCIGLSNHKASKSAFLGCYAAISIVLILLNLPSRHAVFIHSWKTQSLSGPLARRLKELDPRKTWRIKLTEKTKYLCWPFQYYVQLGYKLKAAPPESWDIAVVHKTEKKGQAEYLDENRFSYFDCRVLINSKSSEAISAGKKLASKYGP